MNDDQVTKDFRRGYNHAVAGNEDMSHYQKSKKHWIAGYNLGRKDYRMMEDILCRYVIREKRIAAKVKADEDAVDAV